MIDENNLESELSIASEASKDLVSKIREKAEEIKYYLTSDIECEKGGEPRIMIEARYDSTFNIKNELGSLYEQQRLDMLIPKTHKYNGKTFPVEFMILSMKPPANYL